MRRRYVWILFIGLVLLLVANAWLFLPRFVLQKQLLTSADLQRQANELRQVALDGADVASRIADKGRPAASAPDLAAIQQRSDDIVVQLQHSPYEVSLGSEVKQCLELAQIVSFTLRDASFNADDSLRMAQTSQILRNAATTAQTLAAK
jgi:hypothetical protein